MSGPTDKIFGGDQPAIPPACYRDIVAGIVADRRLRGRGVIHAGGGCIRRLVTMVAGSEIANEVIAGLILASILGVVGWLWRRRIKKRQAALELASREDDEQAPRILSPTAPQLGTVVEALETLRWSGSGLQPWTLELVTGHRYRLTNRMSIIARNVAIALDKAIFRPTSPTWAEIPPASSVSFVCQPAWGSTHEVEVSWDSADFADGRGRWTDVI